MGEMDRLRNLASGESTTEEVQETQETPTQTAQPNLEPVCNVTDAPVNSEYAAKAPTIASSAMVVHIECTKWGGAITDRTVTNEVLADKAAEVGSGSFKKKPLAHSAELKHIENLSNTLRQRGIKHTACGWHANGEYLLPISELDDFMETMNKAQAEWDRAVNAFLDAYPELVKEAAEKMGQLYDPKMYPSVNQLRPQFGLNITFSEVQTTEGTPKFFSAIEKGQQEYCNDIISSQNERVIGGLMTTLWADLREPLDVLNELLDEKNYGGTDKPKWHQAKVDNVVDAARRAKTMNVAADTLINATASKLETAFLGIRADALKDDTYLRSEIRNTIKTIIDGIPS